MTGIIDIGSNTIRLVMYEKGRQISNTGMSSEIFADTAGGILSSEGIEKLCRMIGFLKEKAGENEVFAFATYAFRVLKNKEQVKEEILKRTGIEVDILSGKQEGEYDFFGLLSNIQENESGVGVDLGGGSAQIFKFQKGKLEFCESFPIGCRRIKNKLVRTNFPDDSEREKISEYLGGYLSGIDIETEKLYMMGGTAKTAAKLYSYLNGNENINILKTDRLESIVTFIKETPENALKNILRNRYDNISTGIVIMEEIAKRAGVFEIHIKKCGVRDGYLAKKLDRKRVTM